MLIEAAILGKPFEAWVPEDTVMPMIYIKDAIKSLDMLHDAKEETFEDTHLRNRADHAGSHRQRIAPRSEEILPQRPNYIQAYSSGNEHSAKYPAIYRR